MMARLRTRMLRTFQRSRPICRRHGDDHPEHWCSMGVVGTVTTTIRWCCVFDAVSSVSVTTTKSVGVLRFRDVLTPFGIGFGRGLGTGALGVDRSGVGGRGVVFRGNAGSRAVLSWVAVLGGVGGVGKRSSGVGRLVRRLGRRGRRCLVLLLVASGGVAPVVAVRAVPVAESSTAGGAFGRSAANVVNAVDFSSVEVSSTDEVRASVSTVLAAVLSAGAFVVANVLAAGAPKPPKSPAMAATSVAMIVAGSCRNVWIAATSLAIPA